MLGTGLFAVIFAGAVWAQMRAMRFRPGLYWFAIIASTTVGTTLADYVTRSLGVGYAGGSSLLLLMVLGVLWWWKRTLGSVSVGSVNDPASEGFYWLTIMASQTLGTALGDWVADTAALGYTGAMLIFGGALAVVAALHVRSRLSSTLLFWAAFILTRPLGAVVGDFLDKPLDKGGLDLSRPVATAVLAAAIVLLIVVLPQRAGRHPGEGTPAQ